MRPKLRRQPKSVAGRLIAFSIAFVAGAILVASVILWFIVASVVREQIDQRLDTQIEGLRSALTIGESGALRLDAQLDGPPFDRPGSGWYWQVTSPNFSLSSRSLEREQLEPRHRPEWREFASNRPRPDEAKDVRGKALYVRTLQTGIGDQTVEITASAPRSALTSPAFRSLMWLVPAMLLFGISLVIGTYLQVRFGLKPLKRLTTDIEAVSLGKRASLPDANVEELTPVAAEINRLIARNNRRLEDTRIHFANMAHGLKTPVASLTLGLNDGNDPDGSLRNLVHRIDRRIRHHLADARKSAVAGLADQNTSVRSHLDDLIFVLSNVHRDKDLSVRCDVESTLAVRCDPEDIDEIIGNLLDNAFKWASTTIAVSANRKVDLVEIKIRDDGPGISNDQIESAFRPGLRLDESVAGSGFGLGIAKEMTELYGGTLLLRNLEDGLEAVISLPASAQVT
ncbi:HAMP domain-containing sensor histidine kinase [Agrobacterium rhizogenes]|nr:HAMP domain-containing sensor histidine kinase [Rhizobium rhizogenes]